MDKQEIENTYRTYCLVLKLSSTTQIQVGALTEATFSEGFYVYTGSATSGLIPRLRRHHADEKSLHWHIDYLLQFAEIRSVYVSERPECQVNKQVLERKGADRPVAQFGSSDCACITHLASFRRQPSLDEMEVDLIDSERFRSGE